jgi:hypothetical protein
MSSRSALFLFVVALVVSGATAATFRYRPQPSPGSNGISGPQQPGDVRRALFSLLQPVTLSNCTLERFGEPFDGGYLMCANLLGGAKTAYSYGISGYDKWGCDVSKRIGGVVHQYDCFNLTRPACDGGNTVFHEECVGDAHKLDEGRVFDTIERQLFHNGDGTHHVVMKMDVEGAEWDSLLQTPDEVLQRIEQLSIELHGVNDPRYLATIKKLTRFFYVVNIHYNNYACTPDVAPFPTWAYEVLFVSKRLGILDGSGKRPRGGRHPLDAPNEPGRPDCQLR